MLYYVLLLKEPPVGKDAETPKQHYFLCYGWFQLEASLEHAMVGHVLLNLEWVYQV